VGDSTRSTKRNINVPLIHLLLYLSPFLLLFNVHRVNDARQIEMHITQPFVPDLSHFKVKIVITKWKR
jgi:hypothetical protein